MYLKNPHTAQKRFDKLLSFLSNTVNGCDYWVNKIHTMEELEEELERANESVTLSRSKWMVTWQTNLKLSIELLKTGEYLGLTFEEIQTTRLNTYHERQAKRNIYSRRPVRSGRDNKDTHVGSGGYWGHSIRYPSKKRGRYTWKKFYALFPRLAERDGWDGKTSKRMK